MPEFFAILIEIAGKDGVRPYKLPGGWVRKIDDQWTVILNAHGEEITEQGHKIPPYTAFVEFNGWPAGLIDPTGGVLCAGAVGNEDALLEAMRKVAA